MYRFITLLLLGLTTLISAGPSQLETQCRNLPPKHNFDPIPYFKGNWYLTHVYTTTLPLGPNNMLCIKSKEQLLTTLVREVSTEYSPTKDSFTYTESFIDLSAFHLGIGKYIAEGRAIDKDGKPLVDTFYPEKNTILDTDYDGYAILYECFGTPDGSIASTYSVLSRVQDAEHVNPKVEVILRRIGLNLDNFLSIKNMKCKE